MATLEVRRVVVISTCHVTEATGRFLDDTPPLCWPCVGGGYGDYGWFVYAHEENHGVGVDAIPDDLFAVMTWARSHGFDHVLLDCEGDTVDGLPAYEW